MFPTNAFKIQNAMGYLYDAHVREVNCISQAPQIIMCTQIGLGNLANENAFLGTFEFQVSNK